MFPPRLRFLGKLTGVLEEKQSHIAEYLCAFSPSHTLGSQVWSDDSADDDGDSDDGNSTGVGEIIEIDC